MTNLSPSAAASRRARILSAAFTGVALVGALGAFVLTDDDMPSGFGGGGGGQVATPGLAPGAPGAPGSSPGGSDDARPKLADTSGDPSRCSTTECPASKAPTGARGEFPYPAGTAKVRWNSTVCRDEGDTRSVRMSLEKVRDFYLTELPEHGYGWGRLYGRVTANQFSGPEGGPVTLTGWGAPITDASTEGASSSEMLQLTTGSGQAALCGPAQGEVHIKVDLR